MGFSRQEHWSGVPFPSPGDLPDPGIEPAYLMSPALAGRFCTTSTTWEARVCIYVCMCIYISLYMCMWDVLVTYVMFDSPKPSTVSFIPMFTELIPWTGCCFKTDEPEMRKAVNFGLHGVSILVGERKKSKYFKKLRDEHESPIGAQTTKFCKTKTIIFQLKIKLKRKIKKAKIPIKKK